MDRDRVIEVAPHYAAILLLVVLAPAVLQLAVGEIDFWVELAITVVIVVAYPSVVRRLGVAPSGWR
jgi:hypothetical protein